MTYILTFLKGIILIDVFRNANETSKWRVSKHIFSFWIDYFYGEIASVQWMMQLIFVEMLIEFFELTWGNWQFYEVFKFSGNAMLSAYLEFRLLFFIISSPVYMWRICKWKYIIVILMVLYFIFFFVSCKTIKTPMRWIVLVQWQWNRPIW